MKSGTLFGIVGGLAGLSIVLYYSLTAVQVDISEPIAAVTDTTQHGASVYQNCADLAELTSSELAIVTASLRPAGEFDAPDDKTYITPSFCRIHGIAKPSTDSEIHFEVWMPESNWTGRYYQLGNGGFSGAIHYAEMVPLLQSGNAVAMTDDGNQSKGLHARWALNHPQKIVDWGHRALKVTSDHSKALIKAFYGSEPNHSYFSGCSTGGRQALVAAQRYPDDWDGILVGAPSSLWQFVGFAWNQNALMDNPESHIPAAKLPALQQAAFQYCKAEAQVIDGIAADPRFCRFDPRILLCAGVENDQCLTQPQTEALQKLYAGPRHPQTGEQIYPGYEPTFELSWAPAMIADEAGEVWQHFYANQLFANMVFDNADWDFKTSSLQDNLKALEQKRIAGQSLARLMGTEPNPDLSRLEEKGGKILMYFGWGDALVAPQSGIDYYNRARLALG